jgi:Bacterial Ig-like domain (group 3)/Domain of unknown function (DUF5122) beta-propeller
MRISITARISFFIFALYASPGKAQIPLENPSGTQNPTQALQVLNYIKASNGSVFVVGSFNRIDGHNSPRVAKLTPSGEIDRSFTSPYAAGTLFPFAISQAATDISGNIYVDVENTVRKISPTGGLVTTWPTNILNGLGGLQVGVSSGTEYLFVGGRRFRTDTGAMVPWAPDSMSVGFGLAREVDAAGRVYIGAPASSGASLPRFLFRTLANGSIDLDFRPLLSSPVFAIAFEKLLDNSKIYVSFDSPPFLIRLNSDGSTDSTFSPSPSLNSPPTALTIDLNGGWIYTANNPVVRRYSLDAGARDPNWFAGGAIECTQYRNGMVLAAGGLITQGTGDAGRLARYSIGVDATLLRNYTLDGRVIFNRVGGLSRQSQSDGSIDALSGGCRVARISPTGNLTYVTLGSNAVATSIASDGVGNAFAITVTSGFRSSVPQVGMITYDPNLIAFDRSFPLLQNFSFGQFPFVRTAADSTGIYLLSNARRNSTAAFAPLIKLTQLGQPVLNFPAYTGDIGGQFIVARADSLFVPGVINGDRTLLKLNRLTGALDASWTPPSFGLGIAEQLNGIAVTGDSSVFLSGVFFIEGDSRTRSFIKLRPNGAIDSSWQDPNPPRESGINGIQLRGESALAVDSQTGSLYGVVCGTTCDTQKISTNSPATVDLRWRPRFTNLPSDGNSTLPPIDWVSNNNGRLTAAGPFEYVSGEFRSGFAAVPTTTESLATTTLITSDQPDPSNVNQPYTVAVSVSSPSATPTGTVNISDGAGASCVATLSNGSGSCQLISTSAGTKTLTANYTGNASFLSSSDTEPHVVGAGLAVNLTLDSGFSCNGQSGRAVISYRATSAVTCQEASASGTTWGASGSAFTCIGECSGRIGVIMRQPLGAPSQIELRCRSASGQSLSNNPFLSIPIPANACAPTTLTTTSALVASGTGIGGNQQFSATVSNPTNTQLIASVTQQPSSGSIFVAMSGNTLQLTYVPNSPGSSATETVRVVVAGDGVFSEFTYVIPAAAGKPIIGNLSGSWWNPSHSGEGFFIDVSNVGSRKVLLASWFTYFNGAQQYLVGSADVVPGSNAIDLSMITTNGTGFGNQFFSNQVQRIPWGTLRLEFLSCNEMRVIYNGNGQTGTLTQQRLIGPLSEVGCP